MKVFERLMRIRRPLFGPDLYGDSERNTPRLRAAAVVEGRREDLLRTESSYHLGLLLQLLRELSLFHHGHRRLLLFLERMCIVHACMPCPHEDQH